MTQYKIKWLGWNNRYNVWKDESELECKELIEEYLDGRQGLNNKQVMQMVLAMCVCLATAGSIGVYNVELEPVLPELDLELCRG